MIERSPERDAAVRAMLPLVPELGWTATALATALRAVGEDALAAGWLFPRGPVEVIETWADLADRDMAVAATAEDLLAQRVPARIRRVIVLRLAATTPDKAALRRALGILALPWNLAVAARCTARTVNAMWYAAGDTSTDLSWYTRRASLAAVYAATLGYWLTDDAPGMPGTLAFLDRRLADLARLGRRRSAPAQPGARRPR